MIKKVFFFVFVFAILSMQTVFSQGLINGTVVDIIDGRTLVVSNAADKFLNVRLRYLEVPEPEQQLSNVVKNHLKVLALGKKVYITEVRLFSNYALGVVNINEKNAKFDLTEQMIRDGAGWFDIFDSETQNAINGYQETEIVAKNEKRGVWGITGMKTPWDFRNEKLLKNQPLVSAPTQVKTAKTASEMSLSEMVGKSARTVNTDGKLPIYDYVSKTPKPTLGAVPNQVESSNFDEQFDANSGKGSVSTKAYEFSIQNGKTSQKLKLVFGYYYTVQNSTKKLNDLVLVVVSKLDGMPFLKGKNVSLILENGKKIPLGVSKYASVQDVEGYRFERLKLTDILSIPESDSLTLVIGNFKKKLDSSYKQSVDEFVNTLK